ncbi:hypothetical protein XENOCAPTIV_015588, partial [Xenoophorus captivus]
ELIDKRKAIMVYLAAISACHGQAHHKAASLSLDCGSDCVILYKPGASAPGGPTCSFHPWYGCVLGPLRGCVYPGHLCSGKLVFSARLCSILEVGRLSSKCCLCCFKPWVFTGTVWSQLSAGGR